MEHEQNTLSVVPAHLINQIENAVIEERFPCVVAYCHLSCFTKMSEKMANSGHEGAKALTIILNTYFTEMVNRIAIAGGFVGNFDGDAMAVFFPLRSEESLSKCADRAVDSALSLQRKMVNFNAVNTLAGVFSLQMTIGIASGPILFRVVDNDPEGGKKIVLAGSPLDDAMEAEDHCLAGYVMISQEIDELGIFPVADSSNGITKVSPEYRSENVQRLIPEAIISESGAEIAKTFIDPALYHHLALGIESTGEFRWVSVIYLSFKGLFFNDDLDVGNKIDEYYNWVYMLSRKYSGSINKIELGGKESNMIISFGIAIAQDRDEELAVRCAYELTKGFSGMSELGIEQKIGISSGIVFAGEVSTPSQQDYTVIGRVINASCQIMNYSQPGQLFIDEATYKHCNLSFDFETPQYAQLEGITNPILTYKVKGLRSSN